MEISDIQRPEYLSFIKKAKEYGFNTESLETTVVSRPGSLMGKDRKPIPIKEAHTITCERVRSSIRFEVKTVTFEQLLDFGRVNCDVCYIALSSKTDARSKTVTLHETLNLIKILVQALDFSKNIETKILNKTGLTFEESLMYFKLYYKVYLNKENFLFYLDNDLQSSFVEKLKILETFFEKGLSTELFEKASVALLFENVQDANNLFENYCNRFYESSYDKDVIVAQVMDEYKQKVTKLKLLKFSTKNNPSFSFNELVLMRTYQQYNTSNSNVFTIPDNVSHIFTTSNKDFDSKNFKGIYFEMFMSHEKVSPEVTEILNSIYTEDIIYDNVRYNHNPKTLTLYPNLTVAYDYAKLLTLN